IPYDTTRFIEVSIHEVALTLGIAMILVILVVYLFLQSWRTTLIPAVAVPVSLIGALAGMQALGFSINTLTLFGMVLPIGIVGVSGLDSLMLNPDLSALGLMSGGEECPC